MPSLDEREQQAGFKLLITLIIFGLYSGFKAYDEIGFLIWKKEATATVLSSGIEKRASKIYGVYDVLRVGFVYHNSYSGNDENDYELLDPDDLANYPVGSTFDVEYASKLGFSARPLRTRRWVWPFFFFSTLLIGFIYFGLMGKKEEDSHRE